MASLDCYTTVGTPVEVMSELDPGLTSMLMNFESLGVDCEFGLVQRRFGAEASGLLRWATTPLLSLITMIENDFRGIGELESTSLQTASWGEIFIIDHIYHLYNHTFVMDIDVDHQKFLVEQCSRLLHLVGKMRETLANGDKILVYKSNERLSYGDALALHTALKRYGPHRLLCVAPDALNSETHDTILEGSLAVASVHHAGPRQGSEGACWDIDFARWLRLCDNARASF